MIQVTKYYPRKLILNDEHINQIQLEIYVIMSDASGMRGIDNEQSILKPSKMIAIPYFLEIKYT